MTTITYRGRTHRIRSDESVLDRLDRAGERPDSGCRAGHCQTCVLRVVEGAVPDFAQAGLTVEQRAEGVFLACMCRPEEDLVIQAIDPK